MNIRPCSSVMLGSIHVPNWPCINVGSISTGMLSTAKRLSYRRAYTSTAAPSPRILIQPCSDKRSIRWSRLHTSITSSSASCYSNNWIQPSSTSVLRTRTGTPHLYYRGIPSSSRGHMSWVGRRSSPVRDGPSDGEEEAARAAILEKALKTRQPADLLLRCTILDENGSVKTISGRFKKSELCTEHRLNARDLRKIDAPNLVPTILIRKEAILVQILHIRALIKSNCVILFDNYGSTETRLHSIFLYHLEHNLQAKNSGLPYEFRALESVLVSVQSALEAEMVFNRHLVGSLLSELEEDIDRDKFKRLLHYSRRLTSFSNRAKLVRESIDEVLEQDEDLAGMYLTEKKDGTPRSISNHEEAEVLLESFSKQVEEIVNETETTISNVQTTQEIVELILDSNRNALLALDLKVSIATMGIGSGALVAGFFGMNLPNHLEANPYAFGVVCALALLGSGGAMLFGFRIFSKIRRVGLSSGPKTNRMRSPLDRQIARLYNVDRSTWS